MHTIMERAFDARLHGRRVVRAGGHDLWLAVKGNTVRAVATTQAQLDDLKRQGFLVAGGKLEKPQAAQAPEPVDREELLAKAKELGIRGRTKMTDDELRQAIAERG